MRDDTRFRSRYADDQAAFAEGAACPPPPRPGERPIDFVVGLAMRFALAVQFSTWAFANTAARPSALDPDQWLDPAPGLTLAAGVWTLGRVDPEAAATLLLAAASLITIALAAGFMTRLAGLAVVLGAVWHVLFVLPEAWPSTAAYAAMGLYLALRGAGPASLDWISARLARLG